MGWNGFRGGLVFAAAAAAGVLPFAALAAPLLGWSDALAAYAVCAVGAYLAGLSPSARAGIGAALLGGGLAAAAGLLAPTLHDTVVGAALALGLCRSGLLYRGRFARALVVEAALLLAAVGLAGHVYTGSLFSAALATWAFFLVESAFFLVGGVTPRTAAAEGDPFDTACARAREVLEQAGHGGMGAP